MITFPPETRVAIIDYVCPEEKSAKTMGFASIGEAATMAAFMAELRELYEPNDLHSVVLTIGGHVCSMALTTPVSAHRRVYSHAQYVAMQELEEARKRHKASSSAA